MRWYVVASQKEAGRGVKSIGKIGSVSYSQSQRHDPHDDAVNQFVKKLSQFLEAEQHNNNFDTLTVVAEPRLLGKLRSEMKSDLKGAVHDWIKKDLQKTPKNKLIKFLIPATEQVLLK